MWGGLGANFTNIVASVQKLSAELESQMDAAVGVTPADGPSGGTAQPAAAAAESTAAVVAPAEDPAPASHVAAISISVPTTEAKSPVPESAVHTGNRAASPTADVPTAAATPAAAAAPAESPLAATVSTPESQKADKPKKKKAAVKSVSKKKVPGEGTPTARATATPSPATPAAPAAEEASPTAVEDVSVKPVEACDHMSAKQPDEGQPEREDGSAEQSQGAAPEPVVASQSTAAEPLRSPSPAQATESPPQLSMGIVLDQGIVIDTAPAQADDSLGGVPADPIVADGPASGQGGGSAAPEVVSLLESRLVALEKENAKLKKSVSRNSTYIAELEAKQQLCTADLASRDSINAGLEKKLSLSEQECVSLTESLRSRERSLESAMTQLAEMNAQYAEASAKLSTASGRVAALEEEGASMAAKVKALSAASGTEAELRRQIASLMDESKEKDVKLQAYDQEGQLLAKKQGDMEKMVRKSKGELREKEAEIAKLKDGREQLVKTIEEMQEIIRRHDSDSTNTSKSISAMQAVSQASMERLSKLEADLATKTEEILNQKRALDAAWNETAELKRSLAELRAERDDIVKNKATKDEKIGEQEAVVRDLEQREAVLRATNSQLQDSLQRQTADFSAREDRLREEIADARKRWQDAISNRESLAAEVGQSTAPLLRQISALQESLKSKSEAWQSVESSLLERALRAESLAESSTYKMKTIEDKYITAAKSNEEFAVSLHEKESKLQELQISAERWARQEKEYSERVLDLESRLSAESTQRLNAQSAMREMESRVKSELRESKEAVEAANKQSKLKISVLNTELEYLKEQLEAFKPLALDSDNRRDNMHAHRVKSENALNESKNSNSGIPARHSSANVSSSFLPNGEASYVSANRINQQLEIKEQENHSLTLQLQQLQLSRSALLQEVSYLSARNAELEESLGSDVNSAAAIARLDKENTVLLTLLGEKEEELENVMADLKDVKNLYKAQLNELYDRVAPGSVENPR